MIGNMILGQDNIYSLNSYETKLNNNVLVVGASGAGKTRGIVTPNLLEATGSYIVSDPKGNLYGKYKAYLEKKGYEVKKLDFTDPLNSAHYNFFRYIRNTQDIVKIAHMFIYQDQGKDRRMDPFWDEASQLLVQALIAYLQEEWDDKNQNLHNLLRLVSLAMASGDSSSNTSPLDLLFDDLENTNNDSYAVSTYKKFRVGADKTLRSILITINAKLGLFDFPEIIEMTSDDDIDIPSIGKKKTAVFVVASDTDRSMDPLINMFFTQAMNELCRVADKECEDNRLPVEVRFILDDFATNCKIEDFPRMIASIRSRGISAMLMIQAESQLEECFAYDGKTIIGNCDTYVYMGGNDVETAKAVAERSDMPLKKILNMPVGKNIIFRRGQEPTYSNNIDLDDYINDRKLDGIIANKTQKEEVEEIC